MITIIPANLTFGPLTPRRATRRIILHHSASPDVSTATIHGWHLQRGWSGIGYHFVIRQDGSIEEGRPVDTIGAHAGPPANGDSIGICLAGNFMEYSPAGLQLQSLVQLIAYLRETYQADLEVLRHKDVASTDCPGDLFPWQEINGALYGPSGDGNKEGNAVEPWKNDIMTRALDKKLITKEHDPDEPAPKWFVLAIALNILQEVENIGQE